MNFKNFFKEDLIVIDKKYDSKKEALKDFANILVKNGYASDSEKIVKLAINREEESSTGIGENIAIPHIRDEVMKKSVIFFAKVNPMNWDSLDNQPVKYIFFIALNPKSSNSHVEILASLMKLFMNGDFKTELENINSIKELLKTIYEYKDKDNKINEEVDNNKNKNESWDVVAVTACPTGIAHTFMARDMLEKAGKELGIKIKVETQGADGIKNELTKEDIKNSSGVIIACDRVVELSKFSGHPNVLEMGTKPIIKDAKKEIQRILNKEGKKFIGNGKSQNTFDNNDSEMSFNKFGKRAYKSLLTGVSYMLPFVIFGGILIAIAFLCDMKNAGESIFGSGNNLSLWLKKLGDLAFGMMVPILGAYISFAIVGRQGLLPGFIVGLIAKGDFLFNLNPETGEINWFLPSSANNGASSGVFGAIGGAFLVAAVLILMSKLFNFKTSKGKAILPNSLNGIKNILLMPLFGTLFSVLIFWIANIPLIYLNWGFGKFLELFEGKQYLSWMLGLIIAAMMSIDLGGPINKAAYVFATLTLDKAADHSSIAMAASMVGGMTAPLGIALSTTFFKKLWTKEDRDAGLVNYIMGLTFISEGAIPLTLKNPKVMMPANIIGSAVGGLIIGALQVKIAAPHGGILVVALTKSELFGSGTLSIVMGVLFFVVALLAGAITSMFVILFLTKYFSKKNEDNQKNSNSNHNKQKMSAIFRKKQINKSKDEEKYISKFLDNNNTKENIILVKNFNFLNLKPLYKN